MTLEQIEEIQDNGRITVTNDAYMEFETNNNLQRFNDYLVDYNFQKTQLCKPQKLV